MFHFISSLVLFKQVQSLTLHSQGKILTLDCSVEALYHSVEVLGGTVATRPKCCNVVLQNAI